MRVYNFGARRSYFTKLYHVTCHKAGMIICVQGLGKAATLLNFGRAKTSEIRRDFGQFLIWSANISGTGVDVENRKKQVIKYNPLQARRQKMW